MTCSPPSPRASLTHPTLPLIVKDSSLTLQLPYGYIAYSIILPPACPTRFARYTSCPPLPTSFQEENHDRLLKQRQSLLHCWACGNWLFQLSPWQENLELCLLSIREHKSGYTRPVVGRKSHKGDGESLTNAFITSFSYWLRSFQSHEDHLHGHLWRSEFSLTQADFCNHLLT